MEQRIFLSAKPIQSVKDKMIFKIHKFVFFDSINDKKNKSLNAGGKKDKTCITK